MLPFTKLDIKFNADGVNTDPKYLKLHQEYSAPQKYGLALQKAFSFVAVPNASYELAHDDCPRFLKHVPQSLLDIEIPQVWVLNTIPADTQELTMLAPHVDKVRKCAINMYVNTHGERTTYYDYAASKLTEIGSFVAQDGESWLLDTDTPHSVMLVPPYVRQSISLSFIHTPYNQVMEHLSELCHA